MRQHAQPGVKLNLNQCPERNRLQVVRVGESVNFTRQEIRTRGAHAKPFPSVQCQHGESARERDEPQQEQPARDVTDRVLGPRQCALLLRFAHRGRKILFVIADEFPQAPPDTEGRCVRRRVVQGQRPSRQRKNIHAPRPEVRLKFAEGPV